MAEAEAPHVEGKEGGRVGNATGKQMGRMHGFAAEGEGGREELGRIRIKSRKVEEEEEKAKEKAKKTV